MRKAIAILVLAVVLIGCSGDRYESVGEAIDGEDCDVRNHITEVMNATDEVHCEGGGLISWHDSKSDRNIYAHMVEGILGRTPDEQGSYYNIYRD